MLKLNNISKKFSKGSDELGYSQILEELQLEVQTSEVIAIVGKSGSGKSTLLSLISGIQSPDTGSISLGGQDLTLLDDDERTKFRASNMATIFQDFKLIDHLSAIENIMLPLQITNQYSKEEIYNKAKEMLLAVELDNRENSFPETLSGGERQRVAMARALAMDSKLLLADEPNANLDVETGKHVMDYLFKLTRELKKTMILVTHDMELTHNCDKVYRLENAKLVLS